jgi:hypothetical protein
MNYNYEEELEKWENQKPSEKVWDLSCGGPKGEFCDGPCGGVEIYRGDFKGLLKKIKKLQEDDKS